jgi:hypothetical protein
MTNTQNELVVIAQQSGLQENKVKTLIESFSDSFQKARQIAEESKSIVVTNEEQLREMSQARQKRLQLKEIRVNVEKTRKELKEQSLREGKAIDGMANIIKALIVPVEEHLEKQEKFAEMAEENRKLTRLNDRREMLGHYVEDVTVFNLLDMDEAVFEKLLQNSRKAYEAQKEAERKAEEERAENARKEEVYRNRMMELAPFARWVHTPISLHTDELEYGHILEAAKNKKEKYDLEQEQIRIENEKLKKEAEAREKKAAEEKRKAEEKLKIERAKQQAKLEAERKVAEKARAEQEAKLKAEREKREALEKAELERKHKEAEEAKKKAELERKAKLAPDREKLLAMAEYLKHLPKPEVTSEEAKDLLSEVHVKLVDLVKHIEKGAESL